MILCTAVDIYIFFFKGRDKTYSFPLLFLSPLSCIFLSSRLATFHYSLLLRFPRREFFVVHVISKPYMHCVPQLSVKLLYNWWPCHLWKPSAKRELQRSVYVIGFFLSLWQSCSVLSFLFFLSDTKYAEIFNNLAANTIQDEILVFWGDVRDEREAHVTHD